MVVSGVGSLNEILFRDAGGSYGDCNVDEAASLIRKWIVRSVSEGERKKEERAEAARRLFSLEAMGLALEVHLRGP